MNNQYDVIVVGAGPGGSALRRCLPGKVKRFCLWIKTNQQEAG